MITIGPKVIVAGAATLALGAGTGIATAAMMTSPSPVDSSGVIHGCWTNRAINGSHVFVLQNVGTNCPEGTTAISWNERGPAGPTGPSGPAGRSGAASRVSSLDQLNGIPCDHGAGSTSLSYGSNGAVSIRCVSRTPIMSTPPDDPAPVHASHVPGSHVPGSHVPRSHFAGAHVPGSVVPGSHQDGSHAHHDAFHRAASRHAHANLLKCGDIPLVVSCNFVSPSDAN